MLKEEYERDGVSTPNNLTENLSSFHNRKWLEAWRAMELIMFNYCYTVVWFATNTACFSFLAGQGRRLWLQMFASCFLVKILLHCHLNTRAVGGILMFHFDNAALNSWLRGIVSHEVVQKNILKTFKKNVTILGDEPIIGFEPITWSIRKKSRSSQNFSN